MRNAENGKKNSEKRIKSGGKQQKRRKTTKNSEKRRKLFWELPLSFFPLPVSIIGTLLLTVTFISQGYEM